MTLVTELGSASLGLWPLKVPRGGGGRGGHAGPVSFMTTRLLWALSGQWCAPAGPHDGSPTAHFVFSVPAWPLPHPGTPQP